MTTASKPIDLMCPALDVSFHDFTVLYWSFEDGDRYFHAGLLVNHKMIALWNWNCGHWWYCPELSTLTQLVRENLERVEDVL